MASLAEAVTRVREKLNESAESFWTDTVIENQLNESYRYYQIFITKLHEGYFATTHNISFDANTSGAYSLPSDFFVARLVSRLFSNEKIPLRYRERHDSPISNSTTNTQSLPTYRFRGASIIFEPAPLFSETDAVELEYVKLLAALSSTVDIDSEFPEIAQDCMILRAVIKCKEIEEMVAGEGADIAPFRSDLVTTEEILKTGIEQRTLSRVYVEQFGVSGSEY